MQLTVVKIVVRLLIRKCEFRFSYLTSKRIAEYESNRKEIGVQIEGGLSRIFKLYIRIYMYIRDHLLKETKERRMQSISNYVYNILLLWYVLGKVVRCLCAAYLSLPCLNKARISSNVLFLVSGTFL